MWLIILRAGKKDGCIPAELLSFMRQGKVKRWIIKDISNMDC